jgi:LacI family repressor for deo operon, udp, cdd, tsx, nupC, and nupG
MRPISRATPLIAALTRCAGPWSIRRLARPVPTQQSSLIAVIASDLRESPEAERGPVERLIPLVDGLVLATSRVADSTIRVAAKRISTVVLNHVVSAVPSMITDIARGVRLALGHPAGLGHERVTHVSGPEASWANGIRWRALQDTAKRIGRPPGPSSGAGDRRSSPTTT